MHAVLNGGPKEHIGLVMASSRMTSQQLLHQMGCACTLESSGSLAVHAQLPADRRKAILDKALGAMYHWVPRFSVIIIGPGLGRDELVHETVMQVCILYSEPGEVRCATCS